MASIYDQRRRTATPPVELVGGDPAKEPAAPIAVFFNPGFPGPNTGDAVIVWSREVSSVNTSDAVFYTVFSRGGYESAPTVSPFGFTTTGTQLTTHAGPGADNVRSYAFVSDGVKQLVEINGDAEATPPTLESQSEHGGITPPWFTQYLGLIIVQDDDDGASGLARTTMLGSIFTPAVGVFGAPSLIEAPSSTNASGPTSTNLVFHSANTDGTYFIYESGVYFTFEDGINAGDFDVGAACAGSASGGVLTFPATATLLNPAAGFDDNDFNDEKATLSRGPIGPSDGLNNTILLIAYDPDSTIGNDAAVHLVTVNQQTGAVVSISAALAPVGPALGDAFVHDLGSNHGDDKTMVADTATYGCFLWEQERTTLNTGNGFGDNDSAMYIVEFTNSALGVAPTIHPVLQVDHNPSGAANGDIDMIGEAGFSGGTFADSFRRTPFSQPDVNFVGIFYEWQDTGAPAASDRRLFVCQYTALTPGGPQAVSTRVDCVVTAYADAGLTDMAELPVMFSDGGQLHVIVFAQQDGTTDFRGYARRYDGGAGGLDGSLVEIGSGAGFSQFVDAFEHTEWPITGGNSSMPQFVHIGMVEHRTSTDNSFALKHRRYNWGSVTFDNTAFSPDASGAPTLVSDNVSGSIATEDPEPVLISDRSDNLAVVFKQNGLVHARLYNAFTDSFLPVAHLPSTASNDTVAEFRLDPDNAEVFFIPAENNGSGYYRATPILLYLPTFKDATSTNLPAFDNVVASANESGNAGGLMDVDGDGDLDLLVINEDTDGGGSMTGQDQLYLNNGSGVFSSATATNLPVETGAGLSAAGSDVDGDGDDDLVVGMNGVQPRFYENNGSGVFTDATATFLPTITPIARDMTENDIDNDGDKDTIIAANGQDRILLNLNQGSLVTGFGGGNPGPSSPAANATNVVVMSFCITPGNFTTEDVTVSALVFAASGTGNDQTGISAAKLFVDINSNSTFDPGTDTQLGSSTTYPADNNFIAFSPLSLNVPAGSFQEIFLVYDFSGAGTAGETFIAALDPSSDISAVGTSYGAVLVSGGTILTSSTLTLSNVLAITTSSPLPAGSPGASYSLTFGNAGGSGPFTWSLFSGTLPAGLTLTGGGLLSGTPTTPGTSTFSVRVTDSLSATDTDSMSLTISSDLAISTTTLPNPTVGAPHSTSLSATGGNGLYSFSLTAGVLPTGLSLSPGGTISGTPSASGLFSFTVRAMDAGTSASASDTANQSYSVTVQSALSITTAAGLESGLVGTAYSKTLGATGGNPSYSWALSAGTLPGGLSLNSSSGVLSGTPTAAGAFSFDLTVTDSTGGGAATATQSFTVTISNALVITTSSLPSVQQGAAYSTSVSATGGNGALTFSLSSGSLPTGISLGPTGILSGTATGSAGTSTCTVSVVDSSSTPPNTAVGSDTQILSLQVADPLSITTTTLPDGILGASYSQTIATSGGASPFNFTVSGGSLPPGLSLAASTGAITGTPTATGTSSFDVLVTDSTSQPGIQSDTQSLSIDVTLAAPTGLSGVAGSGSIALSWGTVSGASGYKVYYGDTSGSYLGTGATEGPSPIDVPGGGSNSLTLTGLSNDETHFLAVTAYDAGLIEGPLSAELPSTPMSSTTHTQNRQAPSGTTVAAFRMVSFPVTPASSSILANLEDDLGTYNKAVWRMFAFDPTASAYVEVNSASAPPMAPGRGFWLISRDGVLVDVDGALPNTGEPFELTLLPGFNLIGSPFSFQVTWNECSVNGVKIPSQSSVGTELFEWTGTSYSSVATMVNGRAYWCRNLTASSVVLEIPPIVAGPGATSKPIVVENGDYSWSSTGAPPPPPGVIESAAVSGGGSSGGGVSSAGGSSPISSGGGSGGGTGGSSGGGGGGGGCFAARTGGVGIASWTLILLLLAAIARAWRRD